MSFTLFKKLPPELRIMIWKATLPGPSLFGDYFAIKQIQNLKSLQQYNTLPEANGDPVALFVNSESRQIALEQFTKNSCVRLDWPVRNSYFDYKNDVAVVDFVDTRLSGNYGTWKDPVGWDKITRLIILDCPDNFDFLFLGGPPYLASVLEWLLRLPSLKEIALVIGGGCSCKDEHETVVSEAGQIVVVYGGCGTNGGGPDLWTLYVKMLKTEFGEMAEEVVAAKSDFSATW
jgi:hypothetical protein